jgi:hypothetical protein
MRAPMSVDPVSERRVYENAPIAKAILDIRATLPEGRTAAELRAVNAAHQGSFPTERNSVQVTGQFTMGAEMSTSTSQIKTVTCSSAGTSARSTRVVSTDSRSLAWLRMSGGKVSVTRPD